MKRQDIISESGLINGIHYRNRSEPNSSSQKRQCALTFHEPAGLQDGQQKTLSLGIGDTPFNQVYAKMVGSVAQLYGIHSSSEIYRAMLATLPAFQRHYGILCEKQRVVVRDTLRFEIDKERGADAQLTSVDLSGVAKRHPVVATLFNEEKTLLRYLTCTQANEKRGSLLNLSIRNKSSGLPTLTTTFSISNFEQAYLKAVKKLASIVELDHDRDAVKTLYSTAENFKKFYALESKHILEYDERWVTTSSTERSMQRLVENTTKGPSTTP